MLLMGIGKLSCNYHMYTHKYTFAHTHTHSHTPYRVLGLRAPASLVARDITYIPMQQSLEYCVTAYYCYTKHSNE